MSKDKREQQIDQLLKGVSALCADRAECDGCPFYTSECVFEEPKPKSWFSDEKTEVKVEAKVEPAKEIAEEKKVAATAAPEEKPEIAELHPKEEEKPAEPEDTTNGTWIVSTTMGGVFTKYVFICSKCGYKKESILSIPPMSFCPECEKKKAEQA